MQSKDYTSIYNGLYDVTSQKRDIFITTVVIISSLSKLTHNFENKNNF
jgi:hypothetical protein